VNGEARLSRPALLAFLGLAGVLTAVSLAQPAGPLGRAVELAATIALTGLFFWLVSRAYRLVDARVRPRLVPFVATLVAGLLGSLFMLLSWWLVPQLFSPPLPGLGEAVGNGAITGAMMLGVYVLVVRHPYALEQVRAGQLESELASLRARLEPHFLLNSLNAIAGLVGSDPARARGALAALGDLLSEAVERAPGRPPHTVADEVAWLRAYLAIFEARYGEALVTEWSVAPGLEDLPLPRMLLQPLVENALVHGIAAAGGGRLAISLRRAVDGWLAVEIANSGPSISLAAVDGHGLDLVRRRLALERPGARFGLSPGPAGGTVAYLELPSSRG
jgi:signal transduction histidine kinase